MYVFTSADHMSYHTQDGGATGHRLTQSANDVPALVFLLTLWLQLLFIDEWWQPG